MPAPGVLQAKRGPEAPRVAATSDRAGAVVLDGPDAPVAHLAAQHTAASRLQISFEATATAHPFEDRPQLRSGSATEAGTSGRCSRWSRWPLHRTAATALAAPDVTRVVASGRSRQRAAQRPPASPPPALSTGQALDAIQVWKKAAAAFLAVTGTCKPTTREDWRQFWSALDFSAHSQDVVSGVATRLGCSESSLRRLKDLVVDSVNVLVAANQGLVITATRGLETSGWYRNDAILCGTDALITAIWHFDPGAGLQFSTYAFFYMRRVAKDQMQLHKSAVPLPRRYTELRNRLHAMYAAMDSHEPTSLSRDEIAALAKRLGVSPVTLRKTLAATSANYVDLERLVADDDCTDDIVYATAIESSEELFVPKRMNLEEDPAEPLLLHVMGEVQGLLKSLPALEAQILSMRFGLAEGCSPMTIREIAKEHGMKPGSVHHRLTKGLKLLSDGRAVLLRNYFVQALDALETRRDEIGRTRHR